MLLKPTQSVMDMVRRAGVDLSEIIRSPSPVPPEPEARQDRTNGDPCDEVPD